MRYLGGKSKIAKRLAAVIGGGHVLVEPFVGGGAMTAALAPSFETVLAYDSHPDLILMWRALQNGWVPPRTITEAQYTDLRRDMPSPLRAFAGFAGASWGGKWFGGYARGGTRNYADEAARSLLRDIQRMKNVTFACADYKSAPVYSGDVVYADPPYADSTGYGGQFDNAEFWRIAGEWADIGARVFVSEYQAPADWTCVWSVERTRDMKAHMTDAIRVTERLFTKAFRDRA